MLWGPTWLECRWMWPCDIMGHSSSFLCLLQQGHIIEVSNPSCFILCYGSGLLPNYTPGNHATLPPVHQSHPKPKHHTHPLTLNANAYFFICKLHTKDNNVFDGQDESVSVCMYRCAWSQGADNGVLHTLINWKLMNFSRYNTWKMTEFQLEKLLQFSHKITEIQP